MVKKEGMLFLVGLVLLALACQPDRTYIEDKDARLTFSLDTVFFDTVFTTVGTVTEAFKIRNPHNSFISIEEISLAGGNNSVFRINVDGQPGLVFKDVEVAPKDSMYVFVEATLDPNGSDDILRIQDSIVFLTNGNVQDVDLVAWGQDVHIIQEGLIEGEETWVADKPYLVIDYVYVDSLATLTLEPGVRVYLHRDAMVYVDGSLRVDGSLEEPVLFAGDRLEEFYHDKPGQWGFIYLSENSRANSIKHAEIKCGTLGVLISASPESGKQPDLELYNSSINHMSSSGIYALNARVEAANLVIGNCGGACAGLIYGGDYRFTHCTFYNAWPSWYSNRQLPALYLSDYFATFDEDGNLLIYAGGEFERAEVRNSIVYGNERIELAMDSYDGSQLVYSFQECLMKFDTDSIDFVNDPFFSNVIVNENPLLDSVPALYSLDTLSPAIDEGAADFALEFPFDFVGENRLADEAPDLGAYERVEKQD